jgi:hypothetical protein
MTVLVMLLRYCCSCVCGSFGTGLLWRSSACHLNDSSHRVQHSLMPRRSQEGLAFVSDCSLCGPGTASNVSGATSGDVCVPCAPGFSSDGGAAVCAACDAGTFSLGGGAGDIDCQPCPNGTYARARGASGCTPCASPGSSFASAVWCWPGLVSVVASNPPPVVPGFSEGDLLTLTFSEPTDAPAVYPNDTAAVLALGGGMAGCVASAVWGTGGTTLVLTMTLVPPCAGTLESTAIGSVGVATADGWLRDAGHLAPPAPASAWTNVSGTWGIALVPDFLPNVLPMPGAWAVDAGRNPGLDVGDELVLRFNNAPVQLPLGNKAAVDAVFAFSSPIGDDYSGVWLGSGRYANSVCTITVLQRATALNASGVAVGVLRVSVRPSAGLTSFDHTTTASNASVLVELGTWGDVGHISLFVATHTSVRVVVAYAAPFVSGVAVKCGTDAAFAVPSFFARNVSVGGGGGGGGSPAAPVTGTVVVYAGGAPPLALVWCRASLLETFGPGRGDVGPPVAAAVQLALPTLTGVSTLNGQPMATSGLETVIFAGAALGFPDSGAAVSARYWNNVSTYNMATCAQVPAASGGGGGGAMTIQCATVAGAGTGFSWSVTVGGGTSLPVSAHVQYSPPVVLDVAAAGGGGGDGDAGELFEVTGREFGPAGASYVGRVWLSQPAYPSIQFVASNCTVSVAFTQLLCVLPIGAGALLPWTVSIGGQLSSAPTSSYTPPSVTRIECTPSPCGALSTTPGDALVLSGTGFGPEGGD